jgi:hypothetical protein
VTENSRFSNGTVAKATQNGFVLRLFYIFRDKFLDERDFSSLGPVAQHSFCNSNSKAADILTTLPGCVNYNQAVGGGVGCGPWN